MNKLIFISTFITFISCTSDPSEELLMENSDSLSNQTQLDLDRINSDSSSYYVKEALRISCYNLDTVCDWEGGIENLNRALFFTPNSAQIYCYKAELFINLQILDSAFSNANKATGIDPNFIDPYFVRANYYYSKNDYKKVIEEYSSIIKIDPNNGEVYKSRGYFYTNIGKEKNACVDFNRAFELGAMNEFEYEITRCK